MVRESDYKFITQRQEPKLALLEVAITEEALRGQPLPVNAALTLSAPGHGAVQVSCPRHLIYTTGAGSDCKAGCGSTGRHRHHA